jgi:hypothetical protein
MKLTSCSRKNTVERQTYYPTWASDQSAIFPSETLESCATVTIFRFDPEETTPNLPNRDTPYFSGLGLRLRNLKRREPMIYTWLLFWDSAELSDGQFMRVHFASEREPRGGAAEGTVKAASRLESVSLDLYSNVVRLVSKLIKRLQKSFAITCDIACLSVLWPISIFSYTSVSLPEAVGLYLTSKVQQNWSHVLCFDRRLPSRYDDYDNTPGEAKTAFFENEEAWTLHVNSRTPQFNPTFHAQPSKCQALRTPLSSRMSVSCVCWIAWYSAHASVVPAATDDLIKNAM